MAWSAASGVYTNSFSYDTAGPMTWTAEDCAIMLQAIAGHDAKDPASADTAGAGLSRGTYRQHQGPAHRRAARDCIEQDVPSRRCDKAALEAAFDVFRGLGATLEDVRIRPAQDYHDVKITGAESELYAVHEPVLRQRLADFGEDFLGRSLGALLISGADYVQASRWRRAMIAEMAPVYANVRRAADRGARPGGAPGCLADDPFLAEESLTTPFNVMGGPALAQCIGFTADGLPLSMQMVGRPFDDATVLRVAHATKPRRPGARGGRCWIRDAAVSTACRRCRSPKRPTSARRSVTRSRRCAGARD